MNTQQLGFVANILLKKWLRLVHNVSALCCTVRSKGSFQITYFRTDCMWVTSIRKHGPKLGVKHLTPLPASVLANVSIRRVAPSYNGTLKSGTVFGFCPIKCRLYCYLQSVLEGSARCGGAVNIPRPLIPEELAYQWWRSSSYLSTWGVSVSERSLGMNWTGT